MYLMLLTHGVIRIIFFQPSWSLTVVLILEIWGNWENRWIISRYNILLGCMMCLSLLLVKTWRRLTFLKIDIQNYYLIFDYADIFSLHVFFAMFIFNFIKQCNYGIYLIRNISAVSKY